MVAIVGTLVVIGGIIINGSSKTVEYVAQEPEVITKEVTPDWAQDEEAVKAAQAVIHRKELEAEKAQLQVELEERQNRLDEIDKQLGLF